LGVVFNGLGTMFEENRWLVYCEPVLLENYPVGFQKYRQKTG
jgi:hypothetical protein